jgi:periplasmic divalent cation tolerance protein
MERIGDSDTMGFCMGSLPMKDGSASEATMAETGTQARIVLTTVSGAAEAERLARTFVEEHLAACVSLLPGVQSIYHWAGEVESASEILLLIKTGADQVAALEQRLRSLHSYETPEFLVLKVESGSLSYLDWMQANLRRA